MTQPRTLLASSVLILNGLILAALLVLVGLGLPVTASAQGGPATTYLSEQNDEVTAALRTPASEARTTRVTGMVDALLDYDELAHRSLSAHWDGLTPAQRTEFVSLLRQLVQRQYQSNLEHILDYEITYGAETEVGGHRRVATEARSRTERRAPPIEIVYLVHQVGTAWRVIDVTTDGVSMVNNYRQQFDRIIASDGFPGLLTRMRDRLSR
jgi:phospholipid transport system substrate-binding protein